MIDINDGMLYRHNVQILLVGTCVSFIPTIIDKLQLCRKGKEKFTRLQLSGMDGNNARRISPDRRSK